MKTAWMHRNLLNYNMFNEITVEQVGYCERTDMDKMQADCKGTPNNTLVLQYLNGNEATKLVNGTDSVVSLSY